VLNAVGLLIAELVIAFTTYGLGLHDQVAFNIASVIGTALGTIFRYGAYKRWVFLKPVTPVIPNGSSVSPLLPADPGLAAEALLTREDDPPEPPVRARWQ